MEDNDSRWHRFWATFDELDMLVIRRYRGMEAQFDAASIPATKEESELWNKMIDPENLDILEWVVSSRLNGVDPKTAESWKRALAQCQEKTKALAAVH